MEAYQFVFPYYAFGHRHYHGGEHINRMLADAYRYGDKSQIILHNSVSNVNVLNTDLYHAILFHDVVYEGVRTDKLSNEEASIAVYVKYCEVNRLPYSSQVVKMIAATEKHFDASFESDDYLVNLLLDLDLMAFTDPYLKFQETQKLIDNEFLPYYDAQIVRDKRYEFLKKIYDDELLKFRVIDKDESLTARAYENLSRILSGKTY